MSHYATGLRKVRALLLVDKEIPGGKSDPGNHLTMSGNNLAAMVVRDDR